MTVPDLEWPVAKAPHWKIDRRHDTNSFDWNTTQTRNGGAGGIPSLRRAHWETKLTVFLETSHMASNMYRQTKLRNTLHNKMPKVHAGKQLAPKAQLDHTIPAKRSRYFMCHSRLMEAWVMVVPSL